MIFPYYFNKKALNVFAIIVYFKCNKSNCLKITVVGFHPYYHSFEFDGQECNLVYDKASVH